MSNSDSSSDSFFHILVFGSLTGIFIYMSDMILQQFKLVGGIMEIFKFITQGCLVYSFTYVLQNLN